MRKRALVVMQNVKQHDFVLTVAHALEGRFQCI